MTANTYNPWESHNSVPLDIDESITTIQSSRRRLVLLLIDAFETPISAGDLAEAIAVLETGKTRDKLNAEDRKRVYVSLYQVHLTKLDEYGAIVYDDRSKKVWATGATASLASFVRSLQSACEAGSY